MPNGYLAAVNPNVAPPSALPVRAVATSFLRLRPLIVAPLMIAMMALAASSGAPRVQLVALATIGLPVLAFFVVESVQGRRRVFEEAELFRSLILTALGIGCVSLVTGAGASPALPMLLAPLGVGFAAFGRGARATRLVLIGAAVLVALSLVPAPLPPLPDPARRVMTAFAVLDAALLLRVGVAGLSDAHARAASSALLAGEALVLATRGRSQALEALGAKVAHEVKNPLAAVRALVEVMLEGATGRDQQRLEVASAEVARIESILTGYLSWRHPFAEIVRAPIRVDELVRGLLLVLEVRAAKRSGSSFWRTVTRTSSSRSTPLACARRCSTWCSTRSKRCGPAGGCTCAFATETTPSPCASKTTVVAWTPRRWPRSGCRSSPPARAAPGSASRSPARSPSSTVVSSR